MQSQLKSDLTSKLGMGALEGEEALRSRAFQEALEQNFVVGLRAVRSWPAVLLFVGLASLTIVLAAIPALQHVLRVPWWLVAAVVVPACGIQLFARKAYLCQGALHPAHMWRLGAEGIVTAGAIMVLIHASGSAHSIFWLGTVAQVINLGQRPLLRDYSLKLLAIGPLVLAVSFLFLGQWWDTLLVLFYGTICLWMYWVLVGAQMEVVRSQANEQLAEQQVQALLVERERERIARDLHDGVGAELTSLLLQVRTLQRGQSCEEVRGQLEALTNQARRNLDELRQTVWSLNHDAASWPHFVARVELQARRLVDPEAMSIEVIDRGAPQGFELPSAWPHHLLRIVQEAVRNAVQHARCSRIEVYLGVDAGALLLEVTDDGEGLEAEAIEASTGGLANLKKRCGELGGSLVFELPGPGVRVVLRVPLSGT